MPKRDENRKKRQPEEKEATKKNVKKGRTTLKRIKWKKA